MMFLHVRLQLTYSHAWTCTLFGSRWSARPWIVSVVIQAAFCGLLWLFTWLTYWMAATIPESIYRSSLDGCVHTLDMDYCILYYGWLCPYHTSCIWAISCTCIHKFFNDSVFSWTCSRKAFHPSLSRASCFKGHMLHSNLSPSLQSLVTHIGGPILWPVSSDMTWNHFHGVPLDKYNHSPKTISCEKP